MVNFILHTHIKFCGDKHAELKFKANAESTVFFHKIIPKDKLL